MKCHATKQVQQSEDDPSKYEITYIGNHTCTEFYNNQVTENSSFFIDFSSNLSAEKSQSLPFSNSSPINLTESEIMHGEEVPSNSTPMQKTMAVTDPMWPMPLMDDHMLSPSIQSSSGSAETTVDFDDALLRLDDPFSIDPFDQLLTNMHVNSNVWNN
jgi:WRKY DNA -binding domain